MPANPQYPVPCVRTDANGNPLPCPHNDFTVTYENDERHPGTHCIIRRCNLCPRTLMSSAVGPAPEPEE